MAIEGSKPQPYQIKVSPDEIKKAKTFADLFDLDKYKKNLVKEEQEDVDGGFDWYEWQEKLEAMGQHFTTTVTGIEGEDSLDVHFILRKSPNPNATWLLLVHGKHTLMHEGRRAHSFPKAGLGPSWSFTRWRRSSARNTTSLCPAFLVRQP
jgi:hypothetical protein